MSSLKKQAMRGAFWSFTERFGQQLVQFVVGIILARILEPEDFGFLGMVVIFTALAQTVVDSGFGTALIQKQDASHVDESTVFWFNLVAGLVMAGALFLGAPLIASFYEVPLLKPITQLLSVNMIILSFGIIQNALLAKELNFKARMMAVFAAMFISGVVGICLALKGFGVWALVVQGLVMSFVQTLGMWMVHPWRPLPIFSLSSLKNLFRFGGNMLASSMLNTFFDNIYMVVIGKVYSPADLGFYHRGKRLTQLSAQTLAQVMGQVSFPLLSKMQNSTERMRAAVEKILQFTMVLNFPMMMLMAAVAPDLVVVLLGEKWMPCVPYLQVLCIVGILYPVHALNVNVIAALGRSDLFLRLEVIKKSLIVINILLTARYGILALLWGHVACSFAGLIINMFYVHRFLDFGLLAQTHAVRKSLIASLIMFGAVCWVGDLSSTLLPFPELLLQSSVGGVVFVILAWLFREPAFLEGVNMVMSKMRVEEA